ncbi:MAG TPA: glycosyltransferase family 2 protein [Candidatus Eremiobacteraeota bacterium]|nr:MAG: putative glycosyltransferase EpsE [bacterium ADurb.Bin363]HPZ08746.1 glycosyltransferase family 2 protein [Candidatus Eremiobacteraeota bacterium]
MNISVILPVYNAGNPLKRAIESILEQDYKDFDFIIIDDGSSDNSSEVIRHYASRDRRIRGFFHESNRGLSQTLNEALNLSEAELVVRMDQDDEALKNRLAIQYAYMRARPEVIVAGSFVYHMGVNSLYDHLIVLPKESKEIKEELLKQNCLYHSSVIMRRREILDLGGYRVEFKNAEDYDLWLRVSRHYELSNINIPLLRYRFSVRGMTLGKKWEQFYFVNLALAAYKNSDKSFKDLEKIARDLLSGYDRQWFLEQVYDGTLKELCILHLWYDAFYLAIKSFKDLSKKKGFEKLRRVLYSYMKYRC